MSQGQEDNPVNNFKNPELPGSYLDVRGVQSVLDEAARNLKAIFQLARIMESLPDPGGEAEADRCFGRRETIREVLDDVVPRADGESWSMRMTDTERDDTLPNMSISSMGISAAVDRAVRHKAGARAIEIIAASGEIDTLLDDGIEVSESELESMPQRLRETVGTMTETLDQIVPRTDGESWSVLVGEQAQALIDNA